MTSDPYEEQLHPVEAIAYTGNAADAEEYLKSHDGNATSEDQEFTLAQEAARYGNIGVLKVCIHHQLPLTDCLHWAAFTGKEEMIDFLLDNGYFSIRDKDTNGESPSQRAYLYPELQKRLQILEQEA